MVCVCVVRCVGVSVLCWCGVVCLRFSLFFLSIIFIRYLSCSLSFFLLFLSFFTLLFSLLSSLPLSLLSSLFSSRQQTLYKSTDQQAWRPTLRRLNVIWRTASAQHSLLNSLHLPPNCTECCHVGDGSLPPPLSSSSFTPEKKEGTFHYRNISGEGIFFNSFIFIQKNRRRVKLQELQF